VVGSLSSTAAGVAAGVLSSYPYIKVIGFVLTDSSGNIRGFTQSNADFSFKTPVAMTIGAVGTYSGTTPTWYSFTVLGVILPVIAGVGKFGLDNWNSYMSLIAPSASYGGPSSTTYPCFGASAVSNVWLGGLQYYEFPMEAITIQLVGSGANCYSYCLGCRLNL
jgi:hypothetical protein